MKSMTYKAAVDLNIEFSLDINGFRCLNPLSSLKNPSLKTWSDHAC